MGINSLETGTGLGVLARWHTGEAEPLGSADRELEEVRDARCKALFVQYFERAVMGTPESTSPTTLLNALVPDG